MHSPKGETPLGPGSSLWFVVLVGREFGAGHGERTNCLFCEAYLEKTVGVQTSSATLKMAATRPRPKW